MPPKNKTKANAAKAPRRAAPKAPAKTAAATSKKPAAATKSGRAATKAPATARQRAKAPPASSAKRGGKAPAARKYSKKNVDDDSTEKLVQRSASATSLSSSSSSSSSSSDGSTDQALVSLFPSAAASGSQFTQRNAAEDVPSRGRSRGRNDTESTTAAEGPPEKRLKVESPSAVGGAAAPVSPAAPPPADKSADLQLTPEPAERVASVDPDSPTVLTASQIKDTPLNASSASDEALLRSHGSGRREVEERADEIAESAVKALFDGRLGAVVDPTRRDSGVESGTPAPARTLDIAKPISDAMLSAARAVPLPWSPAPPRPPQRATLSQSPLPEMRGTGCLPGASPGHLRMSSHHPSRAPSPATLGAPRSQPLSTPPSASASTPFPAAAVSNATPQRAPAVERPHADSVFPAVALCSTPATATQPPSAPPRASTQMITKAAAARPQASPSTYWICLDDDDEDVAEEPTSPTLLSNVRLTAAPAQDNASSDLVQTAPGDGDGAVALTQRLSSGSGASQQSQQLHHGGGAVKPAIGDVLSPTFRPRRSDALSFPTTPASSRAHPQSGRHSSPHTAPARSASGEPHEKEETQPPLTRGPSSLALSTASTQVFSNDRADEDDSQQRHTTATLSARSTHPYITLDDDSSSTASTSADADDDTAASAPKTQQGSQLGSSSSSGGGGEPAPQISSPTRSVKDYLFDATRGHGGDGDRGGSPGPSSPLFEETTRYLQAAQRGASPGGAPADPSGTTARSAAGAAKHPGTRPLRHPPRPAEVLLQFFPSRLTRKSFMESVRKVMPAEHLLQAGEFWDAFDTAEFAGEGSFGLVWRCRTVDGDWVAVKSCPVNLSSRAHIDDSYATVREIATMGLLSASRVPYVLPLHSAFYVPAREAMPPAAAEALEWRQALRRKAEAVVLERASRRLAKRSSARAAAEGPSVDEQIEEELRAMAARETPEEAAVRARHAAVRLPRFLSITEDDMRLSEATIFLVMELCDGDLECIARSDSRLRSMAFCVSSALAGMHALGVLHLDLKPSNILFAFEDGPSQQQQQQQGAGQPPAGTSPGSSTGAGKAIKFYLSDFGNCQVVKPAPLAEVEDCFGTFEYMDRRALEDAVCGRPTDCFSLGSTLYEMLFGKRVYPKCTACSSDEDHTRHCFVAAARQPITLPVIGANGSSSGSSGHGGKDRMSPAASTAALTSASSTGSGSSSSGGGGSGGTRVTLTTLQKVTASLLQPDWSKRMTAEQCRDYLVQAYNITPVDGENS